MSRSQNPQSRSAFFLYATHTPDTVMTFPKTRCVRLMREIMLAYSQSWILPKRVPLLRTLGLPVTAPTLSPFCLFIKCETRYLKAFLSRYESASTPTKISPFDAIAPRYSAFAFPQFFLRSITLTLSYIATIFLSTSPVSSELPSLIIISS